MVRAMLCRGWGPPSVLEAGEVAGAPLAAGEVRVAARAAGVNFADNLMVAGRYQFKPPSRSAPASRPPAWSPGSARGSGT
ncbi:hypothetical protein [Rubrobacter marinus]|uniref:hypothetical protein n=1 Tax=Rubrobacter marinus TaxID=2653852 RepID=UPI0014090C44|nr:hypothetical protein [Rubrobacter marinus]